MMRSFIAIEFSHPVHHQLQANGDHLRAYLRRQNAPVCLRWSAVDNIHLTLRFLGETTAAQAQIIATGLRAAAMQHAPFTLTLGGVGGFPTVRQPRVVWLGVGGDVGQLHALQAAVEQTVQLAGFAAEERPFAAHITLARAQRDATKEQLRAVGSHLATYNVTTPIPVYVDAVVHMRSDLRPSGAVYTRLAHFPLHPPV